MKKKIDVLLINPPIGTVANPYISIPVLSAYLKKKKITVKAFDLNREFMLQFVNVENIRKGKEYCVNRFLALNEKKELNFKEIIEYARFYNLLKEIENNKDKFKNLFLPFTDFSDIQSSNIADLLLSVASASYYPEYIGTKPSMRYYSKFNEYSTNDIIKSLNHSNLYSKIIKKIIKEVLAKYSPLLVGISITFQHQILPAFFCAKIIKEINPDIHITIGGTEVSIRMRELKDIGIFKFVNSLILDEGEIPLEKLYYHLKNGAINLSKIPGLCFLNKSNQIIYNPSAPSLDMNKQAPPDYSVFNLNRYLRKKDRLIVPFRLSKGCYWQKCTFCRTELSYCKNFQQPSFKFVYDQLLDVINQTGIKNYIFSDESADPELLTYLSRNLLKDNVKINWFTHSRVDKRLTKEKCQLFKDAGCLYISLGVESFTNRLLKIIKKGISVELIKKVIEQIDGVLPIGLYMLIGIPTETEKEALEGFDYIKKYLKRGLIDFYSYSLLSIVYGSDMWHNSKKYKISKINIPKESNLFPDIYDINCEGMSRQQAYKLYLDFSGRSIVNSRYIIINDQKVELNFDLINLFDKFHKRWENEFLPFHDWFGLKMRTMIIKSKK